VCILPKGFNLCLSLLFQQESTYEIAWNSPRQLKKRQKKRKKKSKFQSKIEKFVKRAQNLDLLKLNSNMITPPFGVDLGATTILFVAETVGLWAHGISIGDLIAGVLITNVRHTILSHHSLQGQW